VISEEMSFQGDEEAVDFMLPELRKEVEL